MQTNVDRMSLGGECVCAGCMELNMDTLLTYNGRGQCSSVWCCDQAMERYGDQLATWGENMGWRVERSNYCVYIERNQLK